MRKNLLLVWALVLIGLGVQAQTYVNQDASGANDGSTWADAYTDLNVALDQTTSGDIWVAAGTYIPSGDGINATFLVNQQVNLYGGFDGTETTLAERDLTVNSTILSGDQDGNDVVGDWVSNRDDNSLHVVFVDSLLSIVSFDGFEVSGGNTMDDGDLDYEVRVGGGIFSYSSLNVTNSLFTNNFGRSGAAVAVTGSVNGGGDNSIFTNSSYMGNRTTSQSAGIYCNTIDGLIVTGCEFVENIVVRGALYPLRCDNITISDCSFRDNFVETAGFGGAAFFWQPDNMVLENSEFINNATGNGGAFYIDGREDETAANNVVVRNCTFDNCDATTGSAGAIRGFAMSMTIENCNFSNCDAMNNGGALLLNGPDTIAMEVVVNDNTFFNNSGGFGGAVGFYSQSTSYTANNNSFNRNNAATSGGSIIVAFGADVNLSGNTFSQDSASFGGAISIQNIESALVIDDCIFEKLDATNNGGAINVSGANTFEVSNSTFELNNTEGFGGAINAAYDVDESQNPMVLTNNKFYFNQAVVQAAGVNISNIDADLISNVFAFNSSTSGGAISINSADSAKMDINLTHNTLTLNEADLGPGFSAFTDGDPESVLNVNLLNNIFDNSDGLNYELEDGEPIIVSNGGNVSTDNSLAAIMTAVMDINLSDDLEFVDPFDFDYELSEGSPAINNGVVAGSPATDIDGNPRFETPDAGAYESDFTDFIKETVLDNTGFLSITPNPVQTELNFEIDNNWTGEISTVIMDLKGQVIYNGNVHKVSEVQSFQTNITNVSNGVYFLVIKQDNKAIVKRLVKM
ncbi:T9SS type A sorting domain-containing protein [Saprospiraceae bacterium]|nr:T9SS type A sorting domain-containing protein [Saprospiraceae bacterium]